MKKRICFLIAIILIFCSGCTKSITELKDSVFGIGFNGNVKLLKEDITVTKTDYMKYGPRHIKYQNYEIKVPYKIDGKVKKDIKNIPVRYSLTMELGQAIGEMQGHAESDAMYKVMESEFTIEKGSQDGYITLKTDYKCMAMQGEPDTYPYIWIAIQLEDDDNSDDYVMVYNPYYQTDEDVLKTKGDISIDQDNIKIEKGEQVDGVQHYTLSVPVDSKEIDDVIDKELSIGADLFLEAEAYVDDVGEGYMGAFCFQEGESLGLEENYSIGDIQEKAVLTMELYNRYAGDETGYDIDFYPYLWISLNIWDENKNNNFCIIKNPYFNEENSDLMYGDVFEHYYTNQFSSEYNQ